MRGNGVRLAVGLGLLLPGLALAGSSKKLASKETYATSGLPSFMYEGIRDHFSVPAKLPASAQVVEGPLMAVRGVTLFVDVGAAVPFDASGLEFAERPRAGDEVRVVFERQGARNVIHRLLVLPKVTAAR